MTPMDSVAVPTCNNPKWTANYAVTIPSSCRRKKWEKCWEDVKWVALIIPDCWRWWLQISRNWDLHRASTRQWAMHGVLLAIECLAMKHGLGQCALRTFNAVYTLIRYQMRVDKFVQVWELLLLLRYCSERCRRQGKGTGELFNAGGQEMDWIHASKLLQRIWV